MVDLYDLSRPQLVKLGRQHGLPNLRAKSAVLIEQLEELFKRSDRESERELERDDDDDDDDDDDVAPPTTTAPPMGASFPPLNFRESPQPSSRGGASSSYIAILLVLLVASIAVSVHLYMQLDAATVTMAGMTDEITDLKDDLRLYEVAIEDMGNEKNDLILKLDIFKGKKEEAEAHLGEISAKYQALRKKYADLAKLHGEPLEKDEPPKTQPPANDDEDDNEENIYCWFDSLFVNVFFDGSCGAQAKKRQQQGKPTCPFKSSEHALKELKMRPDWIRLQQTDRYSKERKKLIKELSKKMHPDKLVGR